MMVKKLLWCSADGEGGEDSARPVKMRTHLEPFDVK